MGLWLVDLRPELELPENIQRPPLVVVVEADELHKCRVPLGRGRDDVFHQPLAMANLDDVARSRGVAGDLVRRKDGTWRRALGRAVGLEKPGRQEGTRSAGVVETVGAASSLQLVAAERTQQIPEPNLPGGHEGVDLALLRGTGRDTDGEGAS